MIWDHAGLKAAPRSSVPTPFFYRMGV